MTSLSTMHDTHSAPVLKVSTLRNALAETRSWPMQVGLDVLRRDGRVFECYEDMADTIFHSELGASNAVLAANFTIDSLMLRYQGIDWMDTANWNCNAGYGSLCIIASPPACEQI